MVRRLVLAYLCIVVPVIAVAYGLGADWGLYAYGDTHGPRLGEVPLWWQCAESAAVAFLVAGIPLALAFCLDAARAVLTGRRCDREGMRLQGEPCNEER
jgi:hypothetical protein